jgi:hypothetical protein
VRGLYDNWLPIAKALAKPLKADRDLMFAVEQAAAEFGFAKPAEVSENIPY